MFLSSASGAGSAHYSRIPAMCTTSLCHGSFFHSEVDCRDIAAASGKIYEICER